MSIERNENRSELPIKEHMNSLQNLETQELQLYDPGRDLNNLVTDVENGERKMVDPEGKFGFSRLDPEEHPPVHFDIG